MLLDLVVLRSKEHPFGRNNKTNLVGVDIRNGNSVAQIIQMETGEET
jgi:hypothetical protein